MAYTKGVRVKALELLKMGESARNVSKILGVSRHSVMRWAKMVGMTFKVNDYHGGITGVEQSSFTTRRPLSTDLPANGRIGLPERVVIEIRRREGWSSRKIASTLGVAASTVAREVISGVKASGGDTYLATAAHQRSLSLRSRPKMRKLETSQALRNEVIVRLKKRHSPEQIAGRLKIDFPENKMMQISYETIYKELYLKSSGVLTPAISNGKTLRSGRRKRKNRIRTQARLSRKPWVLKSPILARPAYVEKRETPGHWEGDLIIGHGNKSALISLIERKTRFALLARLPREHSSQTVISKLESLFSSLPERLKLSLTWDQGVEMARVESFKQDTSFQVYFCDPHSPWQRGSNENLNGLVRDFYPKGTDFNSLTDAEVHRTQLLLNGRPKRVLDWLTPGEELKLILDSVATTD